MTDLIRGFSPDEYPLPETAWTRRAAAIVQTACALMEDNRRAYNFAENDRGIIYTIQDADGRVSAHILDHAALNTLSDAAIVLQLVEGWSRPDTGAKK